jgi:hypothetical protein
VVDGDPHRVGVLAGQRLEIGPFADDAEELDVSREQQTANGILDAYAIPVGRGPGELVGDAEDAQRGRSSRERRVP